MTCTDFPPYILHNRKTHHGTIFFWCNLLGGCGGTGGGAGLFWGTGGGWIGLECWLKASITLGVFATGGGGGSGMRASPFTDCVIHTTPYSEHCALEVRTRWMLVEQYTWSVDQALFRCTKCEEWSKHTIAVQGRNIFSQWGHLREGGWYGWELQEQFLWCILLLPHLLGTGKWLAEANGANHHTNQKLSGHATCGTVQL